MTVEDLSQPCAMCSAISVTIQLVHEPTGIRFVFDSLGGCNGNGTVITAERATALRTAFTPPVTEAKLATVDLDRYSGFCRACARFYCATHWGSRVHAGAGTCPQGHFETLDPFWYPED